MTEQITINSELINKYMTKYIVVKCRGTYLRIFQDMTKVAQAKKRRKSPPIPAFYCRSVDSDQDDSTETATGN